MKEIEGIYQREHGLVVEDEIGAGAFGKVRRARHERLDVAVAVKILHSSLVDARILKMFSTEAKILARLDHPNIVRVFDFAYGPEGPFIAMEWMDDGAIEGPVSGADELASVARAAASALAALHDANIVHRDVKPDNLLLRSDGRIKLADLGVALDVAATETTDALAGTLPYMAPEVLSANQYGWASDMYALGVTLYELWSGERPYAFDSLSDCLAVLEGPAPPRPNAVREGLPAPLEGIILSLLATSPAYRPTASEMLSRLASGDVTLLSPVGEDSPLAAASSMRTIGAWSLVGEVYSSNNWRGYEVFHKTSGRAARLTAQQPTSQLPAKLILESAAHAHRWDHGNLVQVLDWGTHDDRPYVVLDTQGRRLEEHIAEAGPLPETQALDLAWQVAEAVSFLHNEGVVYQLVEPGSVYHDGQGKRVVLGWPVYCAPIGEEVEGSRVYVADYAPPEVLTAPRFSVLADIYGVGAVLWYALSGMTVRELDGGGGNIIAAMNFHVTVDAIREHVAVTAPTAELLVDLLQPHAQRRAQSVMEVAWRCKRLKAGLQPRSAFDL